MIKGLNNKKKAITRLMKNAPKSIYGYYQETTTSCAYLCFSYGIIEIAPSLLEIIPDDIPKLTDKKIIEKALTFYNDILKAIEKERYIKDVTINDLKVYKKHIKKIASHKLGTSSKDPFLVEYKKGGYIGLNPSFLIDLCVLTEEKDYTCITVTDEHTPFLLSGAGIQAILCPVVANANENSYDYFLNNVYECQKIDEGMKALKEINKKDYKKTKVDNIPILTGKHANEITMKSGYIFSDKNCDFLIYKDKRTYTVYNLNMMLPVSKDEFKTITAAIDYLYSFWKPEKDYIDCVKNILVNSNGKKETENRLKTISKNEIVKPYINKYFFDCTETKEETPKTATIQDNAADIVADPETTNETTAADVMSANNTDTANAKDINTDLKTIETPVILRYSDYEHIRIKKGYYINISNYDYIIYQKQATNEYTIYNLNYMMPYGYDDYKTVADAVNHLNDTADKQNEYYNIHNHYTKQEIYNIYASYNFYNKYELVKQYVEKDIQADHETPKQTDKPHKTTKKAMSLFIVTDKPQLVKLYGANIPTLDRVPTYTQRIISRFKPSKMQGVYNTRVDNEKPLKKAYNDFVGTVSMSCDKCAIGGKVAAGNTS